MFQHRGFFGPFHEPLLTERFEDALVYANTAHRQQLRKGSQIPYFAHCMSVASIVLEFGGNEDEAIAALLHDAAEDQGGQERLDDIRRRFGGRVADIVDGCSDTLEWPKPDWRHRKETYIANLATASKSVRLVSAADKLHNVRSTLTDVINLGDRMWDRFGSTKEENIWYYQTLVEAFETAGDNRELVEELDRTVRQLLRATSGGFD